MTAMSRRVLGIMGLIGLFALAACNLGDLQAPGLARDKDEAARAVFKAMQKGDLSGVPLGPEMLTPEAQAAIPNIFASIPKGEPTKVKLLNWHSNWSALTGARTEDLETNHQYTFPNASIDVTTVMQRQIPAQGQPGPWKLRGFHFKPSGSAPAAPPAKAAQAEAAPAPASAPATPPAAAAAPPSPTPARATPPRAAPARPAPSRNRFVEQPQDTGPAQRTRPTIEDETFSKAKSGGEDVVLDKTRR